MILFSGTKTFKLTVPGKAVGQARSRYSKKTGRMYEPHKSAEAKDTIRTLAIQEVQKSGWTIAHPEMPVMLIVRSYREIPSSKPAWFKKAAVMGLLPPLTKPDFDNTAKLAADALTGVVYHDDKQVFKHDYEAFYSDSPRIEIEVIGYFINMGEIKEKAGAIKPLKKPKTKKKALI